MPLYDYQCKQCSNVITRNVRIADMHVPTETPCSECGGQLEKVLLSAPTIGDGVRLGVRRPDSGMKEVLQKIHERTPGSKLNSVSQLTRI